jgi:hypothetical protein
MSSGYRSDVPGRMLGAITFLIGVCLLGFVFHEAYSLFRTNSEQALGLVFTGNPKLDPSALKIATQFGWLILKIVLMFLMAIAGSLISQKGINLYFSAAKGIALDMVPKISPPPPTSEAG